MFLIQFRQTMRRILKPLLVAFFVFQFLGLSYGSVLANTPTIPFITQNPRATVVPITPPIENCDFVPPTDKQTCLECILEQKGSWTVFGCIPTNPEGFISFILRLSLGVGGGIAFLVAVFGAFLLLTSAGNPQKIKEGKRTITYSLIGLLVIVFSVFVLEFVGVSILNLPGLRK